MTVHTYSRRCFNWTSVDVNRCSGCRDMASAKSGWTDGQTDGCMHGHSQGQTDRRWLFYSPPSGFLRNWRGTKIALHKTELCRCRAVSRISKIWANWPMTLRNMGQKQKMWANIIYCWRCSYSHTNFTDFKLLASIIVVLHWNIEVVQISKWAGIVFSNCKTFSVMQKLIFSNVSVMVLWQWCQYYQGNTKLPLFLQSHHWKIKEFSGIQSGPYMEKTCQNRKIYNYTSKWCHLLGLFRTFCFLSRYNG